uniref:Uncharacterized protein n=1 Tax=Zea mays TaxID=4577 RepID=A0A804Q6K8_MAIZE
MSTDQQSYGFKLKGGLLGDEGNAFLEWDSMTFARIGIGILLFTLTMNDIQFPHCALHTLLEEPSVVESYYNKRIVGCPGGEGEDEHDVVWFWLKKDEPHECPVCSQYFVLKVIGDGGDPDGHGDEDDGHH